jgi:hypothetical protein
MRVLSRLSILACLILLPLPASAVQLGGAGSQYPEKISGTLEVQTITVTGTLDARSGIKLPDGNTITSVASSSVQVVFDGGGSDIEAGTMIDVVVPFSGTIVSATLLASQEGSIVVDIWKDTYANFPPTEADTITASSKPTLSSANKYSDSTLSGWTRTFVSGDIFRFVVQSCSGITNSILSLSVSRN